MKLVKQVIEVKKQEYLILNSPFGSHCAMIIDGMVAFYSPSSSTLFDPLTVLYLAGDM